MIDLIKMTDVKVGKVKGQALWLQQGFQIDQYLISTESDQTNMPAWADCYCSWGIGGSGRAVYFNGLSVKGAGKTPFANENAGTYGTGLLSLKDAVIEALYLEMLYRLFGRGIRVKGFALLEKSVPTHPAFFELSPERKAQALAKPEFEFADNAALLVRDFPLRISHLNQINYEQAPTFLGYEPSVDRYSMIEDLVKRTLASVATLWARRISIGGSPIDNFDVAGQIFDTGSMSVKPDFRNTSASSMGVAFWDELLEAGNQAATVLLQRAAPWKSTADYSTGYQRIQSQVESWAKQARERASLQIIGLSEAEIQSLYAKKPVETAAFTEKWVEWLKTGTELLDFGVSRDDFYFSQEYGWRDRIPLIGNDFRAMALELAKGKSSDETLAALWSPLFAVLKKSQAREKACAAMNRDVSAELRGAPEVMTMLRKLQQSGQLNQSSVTELIESRLAIFNESIGYKA
ncbi:hypothetical protein [Chitinibacter tainanensis]|uniref:hypothetical protein n=1 Tax=Chitinibacter tainanensis TaxID=230667 RepID=UPI00040DF359|nr:hypothetical protein [Chitinibacter tainanensis]